MCDFCGMDNMECPENMEAHSKATQEAEGVACHKCRDTGTIPYGGNDGASCYCDCPIGELKDSTIKILGDMLRARNDMIERLTKRDKEARDLIKEVFHRVERSEP
jgi:hypothetical protein